LSNLGTCRTYFDAATNLYMLSENAGAFFAVSAAVTGGWTDLGGAVVLTTQADQVGMGRVPTAAEKVLISEVAAPGRAALGVEYLGQSTGLQALIRCDQVRTGGLAASDNISMLDLFPVGDAADSVISGWGAITITPTTNASPGQSYGLGFVSLTGDIVNIAFESFGQPFNFVTHPRGPAFTLATPFSVTIDPPNPGNPGAPIQLTAGDASAAQAADVELAGGIDTAAAAHGTVLCSSRAAPQVALTVQGFVGQSGDHQRWIASNGNFLARLTSTGSFVLRGVGGSAVAGVDSSSVTLQGVTSVAPRDVSIFNEADAGADTYRLRVNDDGGGMLFTIEPTIVAFMGGAGHTQAARPGPLTDNTGGVGGAILVAVPPVAGSGATVAQEGAIDDNFKRVLDRLNNIEAALTAAGWYT
jgi:hypothetical protein